MFVAKILIGGFIVKNASISLFVAVMATIVLFQLTTVKSAIAISPAAIKVPDVIRACLPEQGRMSRNRSVSCHCPPESLCPVGLDEWVSHPRMPSDQAVICCPPPDECHVFLREVVPCGVEVGSSLEIEQASRCKEFSPVLVPVPACEETCTSVPVPGDPKKKEKKVCDTDCTEHDAAIEENELRTNKARSASQCATSCLANVSFSPPLTAAGWRSLDNCMANCNSGAGGTSCASEATFVLCTQVIQEECSGGGGGDGSGSDCFEPQGMVLLESGQEVQLDELKPGMGVQGDASINIVKEVVTTPWPMLVMYEINDGAITLTESHPIMTQNGWKAIKYNREENGLTKGFRLEKVGQLKVGDSILLSGGSMVEITKITPTEMLKDYTTYNLILDGDKTFYVNGVLVKSK